MDRIPEFRYGDGVRTLLGFFLWGVFAAPLWGHSLWLSTFRPFLRSGVLYEAQFLHRRIVDHSAVESAAEKALWGVQREMFRGNMPELSCFGDAYPALLRKRGPAPAVLGADRDLAQMDAASFLQGRPESDLWNAEQWKFDVFSACNYLVPGRDDSTIQSVYQTEPLHLHDEVLLLWRWPRNSASPEKGVTPELVGMVAADRLGSFAEARHLFEERLDLDLERLVPTKSGDAVQYPRHWANYLSEPMGHWFGDTLQINSLVTTGEDKAATLSLLYSLAYSHGLFSYGRIIPQGLSVEVAGVRVAGPAVIHPTYVVGEGIGARSVLWQRMGLDPLTAEQELPTPGEPARLRVQILGSRWSDFTSHLPHYLNGRLEQSEVELELKAGPLWYRRIGQIAPGRHPSREPKAPLHSETQRTWLECAGHIVRGAESDLPRHSSSGDRAANTLRLRARFTGPN